MRLKKTPWRKLKAEKESDTEFDDNPESILQQSTSQPLPKKQKVESKKSIEVFLLDQASSVFQARKKSRRWR